MKKLLMILLLLFLATPLLAAELKLGYVDMQRALNECAAGKAAKEEINVMAKGYQAEVSQRKTQIMKQTEEYKKVSLLLTAEARAAKEEELNKAIEEYQNYAENIQLKLQKKDNEISKKTIDKLYEISKTFGAKDGYTIILEKNAVVFFADPSQDLTDKLIKAFDESYKK